ncbi:MAG: hypothetical protein WDZ82_01105 [Candidatus Paceibacterota bacterium]
MEIPKIPPGYTGPENSSDRVQPVSPVPEKQKTSANPEQKHHERQGRRGRDEVIEEDNSNSSKADSGPSDNGLGGTLDVTG